MNTKEIKGDNQIDILIEILIWYREEFKKDAKFRIRTIKFEFSNTGFVAVVDYYIYDLPF